MIIYIIGNTRVIFVVILMINEEPIVARRGGAEITAYNKTQYTLGGKININPYNYNKSNNNNKM
jgi:hypothetical protein